MSYTKQNFTDGQTLTAAHLNHMEDGIAAAEQAAENAGGSGGSTTTSLTIGTVTSGITASASITGGKLNLVLPKGEKGSTGATGAQGPKGDTGDTGPGLTDTAKTLILSLFEGAAYGNAEIQSQLDALRTEWESGSGGTTTPGSPTTDQYGTLLYKLSQTTKLDGSSYLDTKVKLFADNAAADWTVIAAYTGPVSCAQGFPYNLFCCCYDGGQGLLCRQIAKDEGWVVSGGRGAFLFNDSCFSYSGKTYSEIAREDGKVNVVAVTKEGNNFSFYLNGVLAWNSPLEYGFDAAIPEKLSLIFGARYSADGSTVEYKTAFTLNDARVYSKALSKSEVAALSETLMGG